MTGDFIKAAEMFANSELFLKAFECYEHEKCWDKLLHCLYENKDKFDENEKVSLKYRYPKGLIVT